MTSQQPHAIIFDLNGTMIDDMGFHAAAWYDLLNNELGAQLSREQVKQQMYGKNEELLVRVFGGNHFTDAEMEALSVEKERRYQSAFQPHLKLIAGLENFLKTASHAGIQLAIGTAAIPMNVDFVLDVLHIRHYFSAIVTAADVTHSKPDPETFVKAAQMLNVDPKNCLVFEDAPKGVETALNANMNAIVLTTMHTPEEFAAYPNIQAFIADYTDPVLQGLFANAPIS